MNTFDGKSFINDRLKDIHDITKDTDNAFGKLNFHQLNWKPSEKQWSVAQCLRHLIITNSAYFPAFDKIITGGKKNTFWERNSPFSGLWGKLLISVVKPENRRKARTAKVFTPSAPSAEGGILNEFKEHQQSLADYIKKIEGTDLTATKITSPVSRFINYSLKDLLLIITLHEQRHLLQAKRLMQTDEFPH